MQLSLEDMCEPQRTLTSDRCAKCSEKLQDYFWSFTMSAWESKDINENNIMSEAHASAKAYVEQLHKSGVLSGRWWQSRPGANGATFENW